MHFEIHDDELGGFKFRYLNYIADSGSEKRHPIYLAFDATSIKFYFSLPGSNDPPFLSLPLDSVLDDHNIDAVVQGAAKAKWPSTPSSVSESINLSTEPRYGYAALQCWTGLDLCDHGSVTQISVGRLILDLLFDLHHSEIFNAYPKIDRVRTALRKSSLVNAVWKKAEYYYRREQVLQHREIGGLECEFDAALKTDLQCLIEPEKLWLSTCSESADRDVISPINDWFMPIDDEVRAVAFWDGKSPAASKSADWAKVVGTCTNRRRLSPDPSWHQQDQEIATWFLRNYDLDASSLALLRGHPRNLVTFLGKLLKGLALTLVCLSILSCLFGLSDVRNEIIPLVAHLGWYGACAGVVFAVVRFSSWISEWKTPQRVDLPMRPFRWFLILVGVYFGCAYFLADVGLLERSSRIVRIIISTPPVGIILTGTVLFFLDVQRGLAWLRLLLPRMICAATAAWVVIWTSDGFLRPGLLIDWHDIFCVALPLIGISWLFATVEVWNKLDNFYRASGRALMIVLAGVFMTVFVGFIVGNFIGEPTLTNSECLTGKTFVAKTRRFSADEQPLASLETIMERDVHGLLRLNAGSLQHEDQLPSHLRYQLRRQDSHTICWSDAEVRFAQLEQLWWGVDGAPLAQKVRSNSLV